MPKYPKQGMKYEQAKRTAIRHAKEGSANVVESMANQVRLAEGGKAANEFRKEVISKGNEQHAKQRRYI